MSRTKESIYEIVSVIRKSDGTTWSVGDEVGTIHSDKMYGKISNFWVYPNPKYIAADIPSPDGGIYVFDIEDLRKL